MSKLSDKGIIIYLNKYNDKCYKIIIFSESNGIIQTFLKKDRKNKYLTYDFVGFECDTNGQFNYRNLELKHLESYWNYIYSNKLFLAIANSITFIVMTLLLEKGDCNNIYNIFIKNICGFKSDKSKDIIFINYINFLKEMVTFFGFSLDISSCFISGSTDVYYISPKTGNCVSKEIGEKYKNKLFIVPKCFSNNYIGDDDFKNGQRILLHFLKKIFVDNDKGNKTEYLGELISI